MRCNWRMHRTRPIDAKSSRFAPLIQVAFAATLAATSLQSLAQMSGMGGGRRGQHGSQAAQSTSEPASPSTAASALRDKLYALRLELMLTPDQEKLWDRFSDAAWDFGSHGVSAAYASDDASAAQALQALAAREQDRATRLHQLSDALTALYATLTPEQRGVADRNLPNGLP